MKLGIVGLPNVGKSTLFNAITKAGAQSANYPFCTIDPNVGVVTVPDKRLDKLAEISDSNEILPTAIEFYDIAGLVKGASEGEGLGNQFLSHIREVQAIVHVVRCFEDPNVVHVDGEIDPLSDIETINYELILSDQEMIEKRMSKMKRAMKGDKSLKKKYKILEKIDKVLNEGKSARIIDFTKEEQKFVKTLNLLSTKPIIYVANVSEDDLLMDEDENEYVKAVKKHAKTEEAEVVTICAQIEQEISTLQDDEAEMFLNDLGLEESGLNKLIKSSYSLLDLISFLTTGEKETRAWTIKKGTLAPKAASKIHSDIEKGFIRAETISYKDLVKAGSMAKARENGDIRLEGKDYIVKDGDVINFRFNV
ncbi:MAG: redox-regulated ATPase YchF [Bacillota bacterium]